MRLVSLKDSVDLGTPGGRLIANVLASVAAYETEVRGERVRAGQQAARANGKRWGGSRKGRRVKVTEEQAQVIAEMRDRGEKIARIARIMGLSRVTVYRVLENRSTTRTRISGHFSKVLAYPDRYRRHIAYPLMSNLWLSVPLILTFGYFGGIST